ncbi:unnamed protein product [Linum tenue]|uniref:Uncharacterized protein n=1 Tax=Linum tenue TaxID=586396 RepID=A0AAV0JCH9_9ROSI|nr:unnamed protein product [Linum tenue]
MRRSSINDGVPHEQVRLHGLASNPNRRRRVRAPFRRHLQPPSPSQLDKRPNLGPNRLHHQLHHHQIHLPHRRLRHGPNRMQRRRRDPTRNPHRAHPQRQRQRNRLLRRQPGRRVQPARLGRTARGPRLQRHALRGGRERGVPPRAVGDVG